MLEASAFGEFAMPIRSFPRRPIGVALLAVAAGLSMAGVASAQDSPGQAAAKARHDHFKQMGRAFKGINDQLKTDAPDMGVVKANAATVKALSVQLPSWFPAGSGPQNGVKTEAKAEAWTDVAGFAKAAEAYRTEAARLDMVANGPADLAALKGQFRATGGTCKGCHDKYRVPDEH